MRPVVTSGSGPGLNERRQWIFFLSDYIRKVNTAGKAMCIICNLVISYGTSGRKALLKHSKSDSHKLKRKVRDTNQTLPTCVAATSAAESGELGRPKQTPQHCEMPYGVPLNCHKLTSCKAGEDSSLNYIVKNKLDHFLSHRC